MLALTFSDLILSPFGLLFIKENDLFTSYSIQREIQAFGYRKHTLGLQPVVPPPIAASMGPVPGRHSMNTWRKKE